MRFSACLLMMMDGFWTEIELIDGTYPGNISCTGTNRAGFDKFIESVSPE